MTSSGWTESWNAVTGASHYNVYLNAVKLATTSSPTYVFSGKKPDMTYTVTVTWVSSSGQESPQSSSDNVTTLYSPTAAPTGLQHSGVSTTGWSESWGSVSGAVSYNVYLDGAKVGATTQARYSFTGEQPGTTYSVTIASVNGSGQTSAQFIKPYR